jgi:S-adenosylmethionine uptake transporter
METPYYAELMVIKALEIGLAVVVAPVHYSIMIWATVYGWLLFGQLPDFWTWIGAAIIVATGIYTLNRERLAARRAQAR